MIRLFIELAKSALFNFYQDPDRDLVKFDHTHYVSPGGIRKIHPHVVVFTKKEQSDAPSTIFNHDKGDDDGRESRSG